MNQTNPERKSSPESRGDKIPSFADKFRELLPGVEFEESAEMLEARIAVLEALESADIDPNLLRFIWIEYAKVCEQAVDSKTPGSADPQIRAQLQIAALIHKALIFREVTNIQRYDEDLRDAQMYALTKHLDAIAEAIGIELDTL